MKILTFFNKMKKSKDKNVKITDTGILKLVRLKDIHVVLKKYGWHLREKDRFYIYVYEQKADDGQDFTCLVPTMTSKYADDYGKMIARIIEQIVGLENACNKKSKLTEFKLLLELLKVKG